MTTRLWLDVEDLFEYVRTSFRRPSGIQRLAFEVYLELQARYGDTGRLCFVQHSLSSTGFQVVSWSEVAALFAGLAADDTSPRPRAVEQPILQQLPARQYLRRLANQVSPSLRIDFVDAMMTQRRALRSWVRLASTLARETARAPARLSRRRRMQAAKPSGPAVPPGASFADLAAPGDIVLMLGSTWTLPNYRSLIESQCKAKGLKFAMLVYDLIPLRCPEWTAPATRKLFCDWIDGLLPLADTVFAISRATAADVDAYARERGIALPGPVITVPIGSELRHPAGVRTARLPPAGSYALIVSTIDARKNHLLLFRVWCRLLDELPAEQVPTLVFAGRVGALVADVMQQIANTGNLGGKLMLIEEPSDAELATLYDGCLFTLFPSFFEGWGLPVTESLGFGKPCLIADRTSLPEAGGDLARSFDPDNLHDAYAAIRHVIEDREDLAQWEARIRREFKPVSWAATADALMAGLGEPFAVAHAKSAQESADTVQS